MTQSRLTPAALLALVATALLLAAVMTGLGHIVLHLRPQAEVMLGIVAFTISAVGLVAMRGVKMDTSYTL